MESVELDFPKILSIMPDFANEGIMPFEIV